jgi:Gram-negative bacterial TonB protein C-terminal
MRLSLYLSVLWTLLPPLGVAAAQENPVPLPSVIHHSDPTYPPIARTAHIEGEVVVKITTDGESVRTAEAETGNPLLRKPAEENARTWKFVPHAAGTFRVVFRYKLISGDQEVEFLHSPGTVEIAAEVPPMTILYGDTGLGDWRVQLKSAHGKFSESFSLYYTGQQGEWLDGRVKCGKDDCDELDQGYIKDGLIGFTITLTQPDGKRTRAFWAGKMTGDKIVGTFVDDSGVRGEWTAIRER